MYSMRQVVALLDQSRMRRQAARRSAGGWLSFLYSWSSSKNTRASSGFSGKAVS